MKITKKEIEDNNIQVDYLAPQRGSNGYIKVSLNKRGTQMLAQATEREIAVKASELEALRKKYSELEDMHEELEDSKKKLSKKERKKLKKDKKQKKKEKQKLRDMPESSRILIGEIENYKKTYFKSKKGGFDGITSYEKSSKKDKKEPKVDDDEHKQDRDKKEFNQRFDEPLTLLRQTIVSVDQTISDIDVLIKETKESRARNKSTVLKDLLLAKSSLFNNRTTNARSIGDLQKSRIDLELKKIKETGDSNEKNRNIALISQAFPQLVGNGAKLLSDRDDKKKDKDDIDKKKDKRKQRDYEENFDKRAAKLIRDGAIELTPHEASIDMEGKYRPAIKKSYKDDDWIVIALDNDNREIKGFKDKYPGLLPKKKQLNLVFDDERDVAKCRNTDRVFQVISVAYV